jgi:inosose dehydratase
MSIRVGTAPDSWGVWFPSNDRQPPWQRCLDEMSEAGYDGVELGPWGYLPNGYEELKTELDKRSLELVAGTTFCNYIDDNSVDAMCVKIKEIAELLVKFPSAKYIVMIQEMYTDELTGNDSETVPRVLSEEQQKLLYKNIQKTCGFVKKFGLIPALHPHVDCYIETEEQIENVLKNTDVDLCFDTGHHAYSGGDPLKFYKKHHGRIPFLHIKECDMNIVKQARINKWSFAKAVANGAMCEPGFGSIDFKEFFDFMKQINYDGWVVVEQDMYPLDNFDKPFEIAARTRKYLRGVGI